MKPGLDDEMVRLIWEHNVLPYVEEHLYGEHERLAEFDLDRLRRAEPGGPSVGDAQGEARPANYRVRHAGIRLHVAALDLSGSHDELLARIRELADLVRALRREVGGTRRVA